MPLLIIVSAQTWIRPRKLSALACSPGPALNFSAFLSSDMYSFTNLSDSFRVCVYVQCHVHVCVPRLPDLI